MVQAMCNWSIRGQIVGFRGAVADVENESTAESDRWQSKQSQVMRGAKRYGGVGSQIMFCRVSMGLIECLW
jgi:phage-related protein